MTLFSAGTGEVEVVVEGARVARVQPAPDLPNVLWREPGRVLGGDRLWLAPEVVHFYDEPTGLDAWRMPPELDPGSWTGSEDSEGVTLDQTAFGARMRRRIEPLRSPPIAIDIRWAGYTTDDHVETDEPWSAWHLVMCHSPSQVFIRGARNRVDYYPPVPALQEGWLEASGSSAWKVGFGAPADGRVVMAAFGPADPGPAVVLVSDARPDGTYVDVPLTGGPACALQVYDSDGEGFCELEHHAPLESRRCRSTVIGAWGSRAERLELLRALS